MEKNLSTWLRRYFPRDILMPLKPGTKSPLFAHRDGRWSWYSYLTNQRGRDVGILLVDLCVIDIDCQSVAAILESKFAILANVPCEDTEKGCHYFFARSSKADVDGYYDGWRQRNPKIDLKTICSNGTSGLLSVTPSRGKKWREGRAPWQCCPDGQLAYIPDELLLQVGRAQHEPISCHFKFLMDGTTRTIDNCNFLSGSAYLDIFLRDPLSTTNESNEAMDETNICVPFPSPYRAEVFDDLYNVCATGSMRLKQTDIERMSPQEFRARTEAVCNLADFMALPMRYDRIFRPPYGNLWSSVRLHEISKTLCASALIEKDWKYHLGTQTPQDDEWQKYVVEVTSELAAKTRYQSIQIGQCCLFPERPLMSSVFVEGDMTICVDNMKLPSIVETILCKARGHILLAGGSVLGKLAIDCLMGADYDFFLYNIDEQDAMSILNNVTALPDVVETFRSKHAISFRTDKIIFQIITKLFNNPAEILLGFDIPACKVGIYRDTENLQHVLATPSWVECMRHRAISIDETQWSRSSAVRYCKYYCKGFDVFLPGLIRSALDKSVDFQRDLNCFDGISLLFALEQHLEMRLKRTDMRVSRVLLEKVILTKMRGHCVCDYMTLVKTTRIREFLATFWSRLTSRPHDIIKVDQRPIVLSKASYNRPICGTFTLSPIRIEDILDL